MGSSTVLSGRPFGGCAILYRKSLLGCVSTLSCPSSRFCAVSITDTNNRVTLLICVYLPTLSSSPSCNEDFIFALSELERFINAHNFDQLIIGGDLNVDFSRPSRNRDCLVELMSSLDLLALDVTLNSGSNNIGFTYERDDGPVRSWPDHFLCSSSFLPSVSSVSKFSFGGNLSDHHPLITTINLNCPSVVSVYQSLASNSDNRTTSSIAWHNVSRSELEAFCDLVGERIPPFAVAVFDCVNPHCTVHQEYMQCYVQSLMQALDSSTQETLPLSGSSSASCKPGWNDKCKHLKS